MNNEEIEFLRESNAIEREYSDEALEDAKEAWEHAKKYFKPETKIGTRMILSIHKRLLKRLDPKIAGKIRHYNVYIGNKMGFTPKIIREELKLLCKILPISEEQIEAWHIQFEDIHPFGDGNGRTGRILMNLQRLKIGLPLLIIHEGKEQMEYYKWFRNMKGERK